MNKIIFLILFIFSANRALAQITQTYLIAAGQLVNMGANCGSTGAFYVNGGGTTGFDYTDVLPSNAMISSVIVELSVGTECTAETKSTTMNGVGQPSITTINECICDPTGLNGIKTISVNPANYIKGGANQFRIISTNHFGLIPSATLSNSYARVTVSYYLSATYLIPAGQLYNMGSNCGTTGAYYINGAGLTGFNWTDGIAAGNTIIGVTVELSVGVECAAGTKTTIFNGNAAPSFTTVAECVCDPTGTNGIKTLTLNPADYIKGGNNEFRINTTANFGLRPSATLGGAYARVTILYTTGNAITITAPNGGQTWGIGSTQNITWNSSGAIANVNLYYSTNSGSTWVLLAGNEPNDGSYSWTIPGSFATLSTYRIAIEDVANSATSDSSDSDFTINSTSTYVIPAGLLVNMGSNCGTTGAFYISGVGLTGFNWTDNTPAGAIVTSVVMELSIGIECVAGTRTTTLNGNAEPSFTTINDCICDPTGSNGIKTLNLTPANLIKGGANQFRINAGGTFGLRPSATLAGYYARVTVTYCFTTAAPGAIIGSATVCSESTNTYSVSPVDGATSYSWTLPSGWSGTSTTDSITVTSSSISGDIIVTANNGCGVSAPSTKNISVNPLPIISAFINTPLYTGDTLIANGNTIANASYQWTGPLSFNDTNAMASITNVTSVNSGSYIYTITDSNLCSNDTTINITVTPASVVNVKAFLSGPYSASAGTMHDSLRRKGYIPFAEPYSSNPYNLAFIHVGGGGETTNASVLATTGNNAIVDWVFLELRDTITPSIVLATQSALIQRDGDVVSARDGISPVVFKNAPPNNYYVVVRHRNHLGLMTKTSLALGESSTAINFSSMSTPLYRNLTNNNSFTYTATQDSCSRIFSGVRAMYGGNCNINLSSSAFKNIKYNGVNNDRLFILSLAGASATIPGYLKEDVNMNGDVRYNGINNDRLFLLQNIGTTVSNTVYEQVK